MKDDIRQFEEMIAECYSIFIGTKHSINIMKQAFELVGVKLSSNVIFYEVKTNKKSNKKIVLIDKKDLKIEILKELHIL